LEKESGQKSRRGVQTEKGGGGREKRGAAIKGQRHGEIVALVIKEKEKQ